MNPSGRGTNQRYCEAHASGTLLCPFCRLHVRFFEVPHTLSIDATSNPPLTAGRWYVGIQAPGPQDVDFNLTATLSPQIGSPPVTGDIPLANGVPATGSVWFGEWRYYILTLPMNATRMEYTLVGNGPGDGDHLYRWGSVTYLAEFHQ